MPSKEDREARSGLITQEKARAMQEALNKFVADIDATGGVFVSSSILVHPVADPEWTDLGETYMHACEALGRDPILRTKFQDEE